MITELIMAVYGWNEVWAPTIGDPENPPPGRKKHSPLASFRIRGFYVGVWTGPDGDMMCTRRTTWGPDAERYRSPPGRTLLDATLRALAVRLSGDLGKYLQDYTMRRHRKTHQSGSRAR